PEGAVFEAEGHALAAARRPEHVPQEVSGPAQLAAAGAEAEHHPVIDRSEGVLSEAEAIAVDPRERVDGHGEGARRERHRAVRGPPGRAGEVLRWELQGM